MLGLIPTTLKKQCGVKYELKNALLPEIISVKFSGPQVVPHSKAASNRSL